MINSERPYLRISEVLELFSTSHATLYRWIAAGKFPPGFKAPGGRMWRAETVRRFVREREAQESRRNGLA